jgi:hypothetical protein
MRARLWLSRCTRAGFLCKLPLQASSASFLVNGDAARARRSWYCVGVMMKRRTRVQAEPETTADLMAGLLSRLGGTGRALEFRVFAAYADAAGDVLRARTAPDSFREGTLFIRVPSSSLAHELTLLRGALLARLEASLGPGVVTAIRTRVGALPTT